MSTRALLVAAGLLVASTAPSFADTVTATVTAWDHANRTLTLEDHSQFMGIPSTVVVPQDLQAGDEVTINFEGSENGVETIYSIDVARKRQPAPTQRGG